MIKSLKARKHELSSPDEQLKFLSNGIFGDEGLPSFKQSLAKVNAHPLRAGALEILQVNLGYMCNQVCKHCHVDAGPDRKEIMTRENMGIIIDMVKRLPGITVDLTGGAPEMNPDFRWFVTQLNEAGAGEIIVRSNLTIIRANKKYYELPAFFKENGVRVVSSLPFYSKDKTDRQRGDGVFSKSIEALIMLNSEGYGKEGSGLILDLVYNPSGAFLPAPQEDLERDFKAELQEHFGIEFNSLLALTNLPISRFLEYLIASDNYEDYMDSLVMAFNPAAVMGVMCRNTISIDYDGYLYDCDFNQMLKKRVTVEDAMHIKDFDLSRLEGREIFIHQHCYGCTAGAGSSCQGSVV